MDKGFVSTVVKRCIKEQKKERKVKNPPEGRFYKKKKLVVPLPTNQVPSSRPFVLSRSDTQKDVALLDTWALLPLLVCNKYRPVEQQAFVVVVVRHTVIGLIITRTVGVSIFRGKRRT